MIAVDTNVLLRALVEDPTSPKQCQAARALMHGERRVRVASIVFVEVLWVLDRRYRVSRDEVARVAGELLSHPRYSIENADRLREALGIFDSEGVDFVDALALADARSEGVVLHTFDRKLARSANTGLVGPAP